MLSVISWVTAGALVGWLASHVIKTDWQMGALNNMMAGVVGAFVGGWTISLFGYSSAENELNLPSILSAVLGAVMLLLIVKTVRNHA